MTNPNAAAPTAPAFADANPALAVLEFVMQVDQDDGSGRSFYEYWREGEFEKCRKHWPEAPEACYIGADPFHPQTVSLSATDADQTETPRAGDAPLPAAISEADLLALADEFKLPSVQAGGVRVETFDVVGYAKAVLSKVQAASKPAAYLYHDGTPGVIPKSNDMATSVCLALERHPAYRNETELFATPVLVPFVPKGFALVPLRMTRDMEDVVAEEDWQWADLLEAAQSISEQQHVQLTHEGPTYTRDLEKMADMLEAGAWVAGRGVTALGQRLADGITKLWTDALGRQLPSAAPAGSDSSATLLREAVESLRGGLETPGPLEAEHSVHDRQLIGRIEAHLEGKDKSGNANGQG